MTQLSSVIYPNPTSLLPADLSRAVHIYTAAASPSRPPQLGLSCENASV